MLHVARHMRGVSRQRMASAPPPPSFKRSRWLRRLARLIGGPVLHEQVAMWGDIGYWPNLRRPRSMSEKLAWCKLFQRDPRLPILADKFAVRDFVRDRLGEDALIPLHAVVDRVSDLDFAALPNAFVLKATHGCKWIHVVRDKTTEDRDALMHRAEYWLSHRHGHRTGEWWYAPIPPRLIAEEFLTDPSHPTICEYKLWCFHGRAEMIGVHYDRWNNHTMSYFDRDWTYHPFSRGNPLGPPLPPPMDFARLITAAECLAQDFEFVRTDLYQLPSGQIKFGELTFCPGGSRSKWTPIEQDFRMGAFWKWPKGGTRVPPVHPVNHHQRAPADQPKTASTSSPHTPDRPPTRQDAPAQ